MALIVVVMYLIILFLLAHNCIIFSLDNFHAINNHVLSLTYVNSILLSLCLINKINNQIYLNFSMYINQLFMVFHLFQMTLEILCDYIQQVDCLAGYIWQLQETQMITWSFFWQKCLNFILPSFDILG